MKNKGQFFKFLLVACFSPGVSLGSTGEHLNLLSHVPAAQIAKATDLGRMNASATLELGLQLKLRDPVGLEKLISSLHDPKDPESGRYLTPQEFQARFGATPATVSQVKQFLEDQNFVIQDSSPLMIHFSGSAAQIEKVMGVEFHQYMSDDQQQVYATNTNPVLDSAIVGSISAVTGLHNFSIWKTHSQISRGFATRPNIVGATGPGGGLAPADILKAYNLDISQFNGAGQTMAVLELDGYVASDIASYASQFKISHPPILQNVLVDGYSGAAGAGADEVTLDIELMMAVAPGAAKILVYESLNSDKGLIDVLQRMATDNIAKQISTSWGSSEAVMNPATLNSENQIFMQMAAQGQSFYAASGDSGAYLNGKSLGVMDPASQPYVVGTGGTTLSLNSDGSYKSESAWSGSGGGVSGYWKIPNWQAGLSTTANKGSNQMRMSPDVSANGDPATGYSIYVGGKWQVYGGTSCVAPIWAAYTALVNQTRLANGQGYLGFPNPMIYKLALAKSSVPLFHDIVSSNNGYYPATLGFDLVTGWGTLFGGTLLATFEGNSQLPPTPQNLTVI